MIIQYQILKMTLRQITIYISVKYITRGEQTRKTKRNTIKNKSTPKNTDKNISQNIKKFLNNVAAQGFGLFN